MSTEMLQVIAEDGAPSRTDAPSLSKERLLEIYRVMCLTRALDERALKLQRQGRIGFYVPSTGQEAAHVGSAYALAAEDWVFPSYRDPGIFLLRGVSLEELLHQCYGNARDNTLGRQMPVHYSSGPKHIASISSPIGTQIVQATGAAMAAKIRKDPVVVMTYFGDGATSSNDFHTALNFAGVFVAPCVFVCENNGWAISCPVEGQTASASMAGKAEAYGMPGLRVDGNDVLAVYAGAKEAVDRARSGGGPTLLELVTFRLGPHSSSDDPTRYRNKDLVSQWQQRDPIARFRQYLERRKLWNEDAEKKLVAAQQEELRKGIEAAEAVGPPALSTLFDDVYARKTPQLEEQWEALRRAYEEGILEGAKTGEFPL
jgi:2-oxoisovalerate dehydrogenase E1 component alpha subunit